MREGRRSHGERPRDKAEMSERRVEQRKGRQKEEGVRRERKRD